MAPTPRKSFYPHIPERVRRPIAIALWIIFVIAIVIAWLIPLVVVAFLSSLLRQELGWPEILDTPIGYAIGMGYGVLTVWFIAGRWLTGEKTDETSE